MPIKDGNPMKLIICFFIFLLGIQNSFSQEVQLLCKGTTSGSDIRTSFNEFPITFNFSTPDFFGIRMHLIPGCLQMDPNKPEIVPSCTVNSNEMNCTCANSLGTTILNLSRVTGKLSIKTFYSKKEYWEGDYACEQITKRKF